jgi:hypothetical protein
MTKIADLQQQRDCLGSKPQGTAQGQTGQCLVELANVSDVDNIMCTLTMSVW